MEVVFLLVESEAACDPERHFVGKLVEGIALADLVEPEMNN